MDVKQLRYFTSVVDEGGFSEAAQKFAVTQPNISKAVKNLEEYLGIKLFYMEGNRARLTDEGEKLHRLAQEIIEHYDSIFLEMTDVKDNARGSVSVGIPPIVGTCVLPHMLTAFYKTHPNIQLQVEQRGVNHVQNQVLDGKLDVGFVIEPVISDAFQVTPIMKGKNVLIVHRSHRLAGRKSVGFAALKQEKFITLNEEYTLYRNLLAGSFDAGFEPRILMKLSQWDTVVRMVADNIGVATLPKPILDYYPDPELVVLDINHSSSAWNVVMITNQSRYVAPAMRLFVEFAGDYFKQTR